MATNNSRVECIELYMVDTSTSMDRRDGFWNFWRQTRFEVAKTFLQQVLKDRKGSRTIKVGLVTYDTNSVTCFGICHITNKEIRIVDQLKTDGSRTATYDAYKDCIEYLEKRDFQDGQQKRIIIITDGGDNYSDPEEVAKYKNLQLHRQKEHLMIRTSFLHTSTTNEESKEFTDKIGWQYKQVRQTNVDSIAKGYLIDYPSEYTGMSVNERQKTKRLQAIMNNAPVPSETTPVLPEHPKSKRTEAEKA